MLIIRKINMSNIFIAFIYFKASSKYSLQYINKKIQNETIMGFAKSKTPLGLLVELVSKTDGLWKNQKHRYVMCGTTCFVKGSYQKYEKPRIGIGIG